MKTMKKTIALVLAVLMMFGLFAGCSANEPAAQEPAKSTQPAADAADSTEAAQSDDTAAKPYDGVTLTVAQPIMVDEPTDTAFWNEMFVKFKEETGADVKLITYDWGTIVTGPVAALSSGDGADIIYCPGGGEYSYITPGFVEDLEGYFPEDLTAQWLYYDAAKVEGKHYFVPFAGGMAYRAVFINTDLCTELGLEVPAHDALTWDVLVEYAKKAVDAGYKGYVTPYSGDANTILCNYQAYLTQAGGGLLDENGKYDFTTDAALEAMTFVYDMVNTDKIVDTISYDATSAIAEWQEGNALFLNAPLQQITGSLDSLSFAYDAYNLRNQQEGIANAVDSLAINSESKNKELAAEFIKFVLRADNYEQYRNALGGGGWAMVSTMDNSTCLHPSLAHLAEGKTFFFSAATPYTVEVNELMQTHQQLCAMGDETPEEALAELQAAVDALYG